MRTSAILRSCFMMLSAIGVTASAVLVYKIFRAERADDGAVTFFEQFVTAGGPIVWFVLLPMSLVTVYLAIEHSITIRRGRLVPKGVGQSICEMMRVFGPERLEAQIDGRSDLVSAAVREAVCRSGGDRFRMRSVITESLQDQAMLLLRKIEWINLIGNVAPMVGLFGTVVGMIQLFNAIVVSGGQPQAAQLAGGISVALVTTFWGLLIAIPALAVYGVFRNRIETLVSEAVAEAESIMPHLGCGIRKAENAVGMQMKTAQQIREIGGRKTEPASRGVSSL